MKAFASGIVLALTLGACSPTPSKAGDAPATAPAAAPATAETSVASDEDAHALRSTIQGIFNVYRTDAPPSVLERHIFTAGTQQLIDQWQRTRPTDEVTDLGDFDWLCQCQDWDSKSFRLTGQDISWQDRDHATVTAQYQISEDASASLRMVMAREGGQWRIADLGFAEDNGSLVERLHSEIADAGTGETMK